MIFKSKQVNLDPWWGPNVKPGTVVPGGGLVTPRPQFEPTRDKKPWLDERTGVRVSGPGTLMGSSEKLVWSPRREQFDTPVNPVLAQFRQDASHPDFYGVDLWLDALENPEDPKSRDVAELVMDALGEPHGLGDIAAFVYRSELMLEHARKVVRKVAVLQGVSL